MKILYFHQHFSTPQGSTGIRSYEMARALVARGHHVVMVCGSFGAGNTGLPGGFVDGVRRGVVEGIEVVEFQLAYSNRDNFVKRARTFMKFSLRSAALALREPYDLIFATSTPLTAAIPGIVARWMRGRTFVFEVRDLWPELPKAMGVITNKAALALMSGLEWMAYHSAKKCIGLSPGIVEGIARRGIASGDIALIPNGCDLKIFAEKANAWRPEGVAPTDLMAVFTGTHGIANGLSAALDAATCLKKRGRDDIAIVLIGDGMQKDDLVARARAAGLDKVVFCAPVNKSRLAGLMASADLGLQLLANVPAFYFGTSPNKFFDYLAAGLPSLINYPGWLAELVSEHECGLRVPPDDPDAFADALEWACDHRQELREMGKRSRALAETHFDRAKLAEEFMLWLESAVQ